MKPGNARPRFFHLDEDSAIINRYGFPSRGAHIVLAHLRSYLAKHPPSSAPNRVLAVNLGKNKSSPPDSIDDFVYGVKTFGPLADALVVNVSSPNTPGLRGLQNRGMLEELLAEVVKTKNALGERKDGWKWARPKILLKIAPDLSVAELQDIAEVVRASGVDGVIVSNTTVQRPSSLKSGLCTFFKRPATNLMIDASGSKNSFLSRARRPFWTSVIPHLITNLPYTPVPPPGIYPTYWMRRH